MSATPAAGEPHGTAAPVDGHRAAHQARAIDLALVSHTNAGKTTLARTLLHRPRHLLLDEPSRGLDVMSTRALRRALISLRADGCCVIMATHVMQEVTHLCDDVIVIAKGHTVAQGSPEDLCRRTGIANLEDAFVSLVGTEEGIAA